MLNLKSFESKISTPFGSRIKLDTVSNLIQENYFKLNTLLNLKDVWKYFKTYAYYSKQKWHESFVEIYSNRDEIVWLLFGKLCM
jgi:hypothetical protein